MSVIETNPSRIKADEFELLPDWELFELVDGQLVRRKEMGAFENAVALVISSLLLPHIRKHRLGWLLGSETNYKVIPNSETTRRPDITFIRRGRFPDDKLPPGILTLAPDLMIEVVSPTNSANEIEEKVKLFLEAGTQLAWIVYPSIRSVRILRPDGSGQSLDANAVINGENVVPGFSCKVSEFFEIE